MTASIMQIRSTASKVTLFIAINLLVSQLPSTCAATANQATGNKPTSPSALPKPSAVDLIVASEELPALPVAGSHLSVESRHRSTQVQQASNRTGSQLLSNVRAHWRQMDRSIGDSMGSYAKHLRQILDESLGSSVAANISKKCRAALGELVDSLDERHLWASQMLDASALRLPSGLLEGTLTELGNFDQCMSIVGRTVNPSSLVYGQYCGIVVKPIMIQRPRLHTVCRKLPALSANTSSGAMKLLSLNSHQFYYVGLRLGLCVPSKCHQTDVQQLVSAFLSKYDLIGQVKSCQNRAPSSLNQQPQQVSSVMQWIESMMGFSSSSNSATLESQRFDNVQKCIILAFATLFTLTLIGTLLDLSSSQRLDESLKACNGDPAELLRNNRAAKSICMMCKSPIAAAHKLDLSCTYLAPFDELDKSQAASAWFCSVSCLEQQVKALRGGCKAAFTAAADMDAKARRYWHYQVCPSSSAATINESTGVRADPMQYLNEHDDEGLFDESHASHCSLPIGSQSAAKQNNGRRLAPLIGPQINPLAQLAGNGNTCYSSDESTLLDRNKLFRTGNTKAANDLSRDIDRYAKQQRRKQQQPAGRSLKPEANPTELPANAHVVESGGFRAFMLCFSLRVNLRIICRLNGGAKGSKNENNRALNDDISCIHGLRTLAMVWIIFGHTIGLVSPEMMNNLFPLARLSCQSRLLQALLNATLAVDTFFLISGLVTAISFARKCSSVVDLIAGLGSPSTTTTTASSLMQRYHSQRLSNQQVNEEAVYKATPATTEATDSTSLSSSSSDSSMRRSTSSSRSASSSLPLGIDRVGKTPQRLHWTQIQPRVSTGEPHTAQAAWPTDFRPLLWLAMRYLRLTPAYAATIGVTILMPALGSGPFWTESIEPLGDQCRSNWWLNLLYVNNFFQTDKLCLIHSWYLSNDCQMFVLATILLAALYKSRRLALFLAIAVCLASSALTFAITVANELPPTIVTTSPALAERWLFIHSLYYKPWPHLTSYIIGLCTGYLIVQSQLRGIQRKHRNWQRNICWFAFTLLALAIINSIYPWNMGFQVDPLATGLHSATFRSLWALCNAWLIWALVTSPKKFSLGSLLSWSGFQLSSRLTFCAYLVHPIIIYYHFGTLRERMDSSVYGQLHRFFGTLLMSFMAALVLSLLVESPVIQLQRLLSSPKKKGKPAPGNAVDNIEPPKKEQDPMRRATKVGKHRHHRRQWPVRLTSTNNKATSLTPIEQLIGSNCETDLKRASGRKISSSSNSTTSFTTDQATRHLLKKKSASDLHQKQMVHFCPHLTTPLPAPIPPAVATSGAKEAGDESAGSGASEHSALDEQFQRKLAQAIGRGFKIRSKIAAANYTAAGQQVPSVRMKLPGAGSALQATTKSGNAKRTQVTDCDHHHKCSAASVLAPPVSCADEQQSLPVAVDANNKNLNLRPTRPNRGELSTFLAHCNVQGTRFSAASSSSDNNS